MSNSSIPQALLDSIKSSRLVVFVGAGCSTGSGIPGWSELVIGFIEDHANYIDGADSLIGVIRSGYMSPLDALDKLESRKKYLYEYVRKVIVDRRSESEIHCAIWGVSKKVVTTNFDKFLDARKPPETRVLISNSDYSMSLIGDLESYLFKAHGDIDQPDQCAIFSSDYAGLYRIDGIFTEELKGILKSNSVLFIGFSFSDPYFEVLFNTVQSIYGEYAREHFIVSVDPMPISGVTNIPIKSWGELLPFLNKLSDFPVSTSPSSGGEVIVNNDVDAEDEEPEVQISGGGVDAPPDVPIFVGRAQELGLLRSGPFKSICITGIGGQGKSALAARHMESCGDLYKECFWRDFKEEGHNYIAKIGSIIKSICGEGVESDLVGLSEEETTSYLFDVLSKDSYLIVLDNVDSYVDPAALTFVGPIARLQSLSESRKHSSKFIFTCRPFIQHASSNFFQMKISGFEMEDISELIRKSDVSLSLSDKAGLAEKIFKITNGHPLWTHLIIAQASRGRSQVDKFISEIERRQLSGDQENAILAQEMLSSVWETLNKNQRLLLRILSESPGSESIDDLEHIASRELNHNHFTKSLKTLRALGLIIDKVDGAFIELHPLVKQFVFNKYPGNERRRFIALFVDHLGGVLLILRAKISAGLAFKDFEKWMDSISLSITAGDLKGAYNLLAEVFGPMKSAGHSEALVKICIEFIDALRWSPKFDSGLKNFDGTFSEMLKLLAEYGDLPRALGYLEKYDEVVGGMGDRAIRSASIRCYLLWVSGNLTGAIREAERGEYLMSRVSVDDKYNIKHTLALARRDSKDPDALSKALNTFLQGERLESVIDLSKLDDQLGAPYYGNIGRCLFFMGNFEQTLICCAKAYRLLMKSDSGDKILNLGFACHWIFDALPDSDSMRLVFLASAFKKWRQAAPPMANRLKYDYATIFESPSFSSIDAMEDWQIDKACDEWVRSVLDHPSSVGVPA